MKKTLLLLCVFYSVICHADDSLICPARVSSLGTQLAIGRIKSDDFQLADNGRASIVELKNTLNGARGKLNETQREDCKQRLGNFEQYQKERVSELSKTKNTERKESSSCGQFYQGQIVRGKIFNQYYVGEVKVLGVGNGQVSLESMKSNVTDQMSCDDLIGLMNR